MNSFNIEKIKVHGTARNYLSYFGDTEVWPKHSSLGRKKIGEISWYVYLHVQYQEKLLRR